MCGESGATKNGADLAKSHPEDFRRQTSSPSSEDDGSLDFRFMPGSSRPLSAQCPRALSEEQERLWAEIDEKREAQRLQRKCQLQDSSQKGEPSNSGSPTERPARPPRILTPASATSKASADLVLTPPWARAEEKTPQTSKSHVELWNTAGETLIFFDWDDTLCPTTYIWDDPRLKWSEVAPCFVESGVSDVSEAGANEPTLLQVLDEHQNAVIALLRLAVEMGQVVIVTLAQVGWVETSCRNFMPKLVGLLDELCIEVVYARQAIPSHYLRMAQQDRNELQKVLKTRAMSQVIKKFYSLDGSKRGRSWKNIVSIGDSAAERLALQDVIFRRVQRDSRGAPKECRCKVVKLLPEPSAERLTAEVQVLITWLLTIVSQDDDLDIDFSDIEEAPESPVILSERRRCNNGSRPPSPQRAEAEPASQQGNGGYNTQQPEERSTP